MEGYLEYMAQHGHEQLVFFADASTSLRGAIAIHDTTLGPALGGLRIWPHPTEQAAILDVLRLSEAMTYKSAAAGLDLGGGKAVIIGDPATCKTEALLRVLGRQVEALGGRYITTEDVGTGTADMQQVRKETAYVTGLPVEVGGSGDPSPMTAYGIYQGMLACAQHIWGTDDLNGATIVLQGLGKVGSYLLPYLKGEGAILVGSDLDPSRLERAQVQYGLKPIAPDEVYSYQCDIFAPCALGGVLNDQTIPQLHCQAVCGGANNQLLEPRHGEDLQSRNILYAPDYVVNAGGVINLSFEIGRTYSPEEARRKTGQIYHTLQEVFDSAKSEGIATADAANRLAEARIRAVRAIRLRRLGERRI